MPALLSLSITWRIGKKGEFGQGSNCGIHGLLLVPLPV